MDLRGLLQSALVGIQEALAFSEYPSVINGISDEKGQVHPVQAPALQYLKPNVPQDVKFRWLYKNLDGEMVPADPPDTRRVERRDCGIIPLYYFV
ncbi:hypothetical protein [Agrobacterium tumefaciens]|uniref:hypothetical protein n=1 Tax=Agrobacterium tumefaciens TaxID=358 RepID=UPI001573F8E9|nr:hypothetical protein [Agrobacterium tumefaciens]NTB05874.1 hypothetical protein [Agrobacterium tumefaciens]